MRYFIAIFCSPLACFLALRPGAAILNALLYFGAFFGWLLFAGPGLLLWFLGVIHAWIVISNAKADRRVDRVIHARQRPE
jgi:uncharacterized membrane protein YqaE (UPF0057 family)